MRREPPSPREHRLSGPPLHHRPKGAGGPPPPPGEDQGCVIRFDQNGTESRRGHVGAGVRYNVLQRPRPIGHAGGLPGNGVAPPFLTVHDMFYWPDDADS